MKKKAESTKQNQSRNPTKPAKMPDEKKNAMAADASESAGDIIDLILRDHKPLKELIETLKDGDLERADKESSLEAFVPLLLSHAKAEEKSLYVQMKETDDLRVEGYEGDTEHAIADQLVQEINATPNDDEWNAKVKVLAELVEHHIEEEEEEMLPEVAKSLDEATRIAVGEQYQQLKTEIDLLRRLPAQGKPTVERFLN